MATVKSAVELKAEEIAFYTARVESAKAYLAELNGRKRKTARINFAELRLANEMAALEAAKGV